MRWFGGTFDREEFANALCWRNAALLALTLGWPFMLMTLTRSRACAVDSCGAVALVFSMYLKPLIYLGFVVSLVGPVLRRLRDVAVPRWYLIPLLLLLLQGGGFWLAASAPWSVAFVFGLSGGVTPVVLASFAFLTFFAFASPQYADIRSFRIPSMLLIASAALTALPFAFAYSGVALFSGPRSGAVMALLFWPYWVLDVVPAVLAVLAFRELGQSADTRGAIGKATLVLGSLMVAAAAIALMSSIFAMASRFFVDRSSSASLNIEAVASYARLAELIILMLLPFLSRLYFKDDAAHVGVEANIAHTPTSEGASSRKRAWEKSARASGVTAFGRRPR
jgi:hypothetical protein